MEEQRITQIEKYLSGELSIEAKQAFEKELLTDKKLAMELEQYKDIIGGLRLHNNKKLKNRLNEIHDQVIDTNSHKAKTRPISRKLLYGIAVAASFLILVSLFIFNNKSTDHNALFASHFSPYKMDWDSRGAENVSILEEAKNLYQNKNYKDLSLFLDRDSVQIKLSDVRFTMIKGIVSMENERILEARQYFKTASNNPILFQEAQWYSALSYLKENDIKNCKLILHQITSDKNADYYKEANTLLKDL